MKARTAFEMEYSALVQRSHHIHTIGDAIQILWQLTVDGINVLCYEIKAGGLSFPYLRYVETTPR